MPGTNNILMLYCLYLTVIIQLQNLMKEISLFTITKHLIYYILVLLHACKVILFRN